MEVNENNEEIPLGGASIFWLDTTIGTTTDFDGTFTIPYKKEYAKLVISYVGFKTDTLTITNVKPIKHILQSENSLDEVSITSQKQATRKSYLQAANILNISSDELLKAACCNLSESFETNPSIDVNFADAVSGTKQIKLLGLTSPYILIATENIPSIRGASQAYGLSFIPGTWVESIQITKGAGSVINGFESFSGQINAELQKPRENDKLFVNAYASGSARFELNTHLNKKVSDRWDTGLFVHGNLRESKFDRNNDSFLDVPLMKQVNVINRWQYTDTQNGFVSFINFRYLNDEKQSGQTQFNPDIDRLTTNAWGSEIDTERFEVSAKLGYVNPELPYQSIGAQFAYSNHDQNSFFGLRTYDITQNSLYSNIIYNSILGDTRHKFKTGISFTYDDYDELVLGDVFKRTERSVGGFFEYTFDNIDDLNLTAGVRIDTHNLLGTFITPRFHLRYTPWERSALKASFGRGKRSANIFAENQKFFASSRSINILNSDGPIYGLEPEIAWNYGVSFLQGFNLFGRKADVTLDFYRTDFQNQVIVDSENPLELNFYNLEGDSFANSFQAEFNYNLAERLDLRFAYKFYDVKTDFLSGELQTPLTPKNRIFANTSYETKQKDNEAQWKFDATFNWIGEQRFPSTVSSPIEFQRSNFTPTVITLNAQITKVFSKTFEVYLGGENINNIRQDNPVVSNDNPFGQNFDTTFVYGPIFGSTYYVGLRFKIE
ncbi:TonB-dependent receptor [Flavobacteriaceae bacterium AU392]|nr:TonB-dependent receptor [Flavobacteriaceae bacterium]RKM81495.1 TonB-dependent receptor [Flavobacteriaceae bacterium AU392]